MCTVMEDMRNEAVEKDRIQNAIEMLKDGSGAVQGIGRKWTSEAG